MNYLELFFVFFQIGLFAIGGGYAALPLIQNQVVDVHGWLTLEEMIDLITLSQMTPGPIGINAATFVGTRIAGFSGAVVATLGLVAPSCIIVLTISYFYFKYQKLTILQGILGGIRPTIVALIATAAVSMITISFWIEPIEKFSFELIKSINIPGVIIFVVGLIVLVKFKASPILVIALSGIVGIVVYHFF